MYENGFTGLQDAIIKLLIFAATTKLVFSPSEDQILVREVQANTII